VGDHTADLTIGQVLVFEPEVAYDVEAVEESAFLLSMAFVGHAGEGD
jgi:hypothetical protein